MSDSVGDDFPKQQARARELLKAYHAIGPAGQFGAIIIEATLKQAEEAMASGDVIKILAAYQDLQGLK